MSSRKYQQYPAEFRESSARLALESDQPMSHTARELGVTVKRLYCWVSAYSGSNDASRSVKEPACEEIKRLKKELSKVKMERDILKKAAVDSTCQCNIIYNYLFRGIVAKCFPWPFIQLNSHSI